MSSLSALASYPTVAESPPPTPPRAPALRSLRKTDLLIVDAHPVVRQGVRLFIQECDWIGIVDDVASGGEAMGVCRRTRPDLVLLDPWLPDMLFTEAVRRLRAISRASKIVMFAAHLSPSVLDAAAPLDVDGVLCKDASPQHFLDVIARVAAGEVIAAPVKDEDLRRAAEKIHCTPLTSREHEILRRAARGETNAEIAKAIFLAPTTVKSYIQSALRKLEVRNRVEAVYKLSELQVL